ncbi:MAG: response regulator transcription factor [Roseivirga sp.]|nr:response regulator transcription factor [Roseivirga sp.]
MIKALIIDDEESGCEVLEELIALEHRDIELIPSENTVQGAIRAINSHAPDLIFLDIKLNGRSGFDVLERTGVAEYEVIFVTAYSEYALKAIKAAAIDYLLKPVSRAELREAISRARTRIDEGIEQTDKAPPLRPPQAQVVDHSRSDKLAIPTNEGYELHSASDILYLVADRNYTKVHFADKSTRLTTKTLGAYEAQLTNAGFMRIHRSYMINLDEIKLYSPGNGGYVKMSDGRRLEVSRRKKKELMSLINLENDLMTTG